MSEGQAKSERSTGKTNKLEREIFQHCFQYSFKAGALKTEVWNSAV